MSIHHTTFVVVLVCLIGLIPDTTRAQQRIIDQFLSRSHESTTRSLPYRLFVPADYDSTQSYPLVLTLHGYAQQGTGNDHIEYPGSSPTFATGWAEPETQARWPSFVVAPQTNTGWSSQDPLQPHLELEIAIEIVESLSSEFNIDQDRLYVTGLSLGGFGTYAALFHHPNRFAAAVPLAGAFNGDSELDSVAADVIGDTPLWIAHGELDTVVRTELSKRMVAEFESRGRTTVYTHCGPFDGPAECSIMSPGALDSALAMRPNFLYSGYPALGHVPEVIDLTYENVKLRNWVFEQFLLDPEAIEVTAPNDYAKFTNVAQLEWIAQNPTDTVEVWYSADLGVTWELLAADVMESGAGEFDLSQLSETSFAKFRIMVRNERGFVYGRSESVAFIVDQPGDGSPQVDVLNDDFRAGPLEITDTEFSLQVRVADTESATLATTVLYSADGGDTFETVQTLELQGGLAVHEILIPMKALPNSDRAIFSVVASDGVSETSDSTPLFRKTTPRSTTSVAEHIDGPSGAEIDVAVVSPQLLTGHTYRMSFNSLSKRVDTYSVTDVDLDELVLSNIPVSSAESPEFDGLRLQINDLEKAQFDPDRTGWSAGTTTARVSVSSNSVSAGGTTLDLLATPADYRVVMASEIQGSSLALLGFPEKPIRFTVENVQAGELREVLFADPDGSGYPSSGELFYILEPDSIGDLQLAWRVSFLVGRWDDPTAGDILDIFTLKPLTGDDVYEFSGTVTTTASESEPLPEGFDLKGNYPNPFVRSTTIPYVLADAARVTLTIHDLLGRQLVELTAGRQTAGEHFVTWDGTSSGRRLPSGTYFYTLSSTAADGTALRRQTRPLSIVR